MTIPSHARKTVAFLAYESADGKRRFCGTAFFVSLPRDDRTVFGYLVTARHVIDGIRTRSGDATIWVRVNTSAGGFRHIGVPLNEWVVHSDSTVDVAVWSVPGLPDDVDAKWIPESMIADDALVRDCQIDVGDEVFVLGLFVNHSGHNRNLPIVRVGNIAAMPEEKVDSAIGPLDAYLIEARSIGGLSGSPVFVKFSPVRERPNWNRSMCLIGLIHGHWDLSAAAAAEVVEDALENERINKRGKKGDIPA